MPTDGVHSPISNKQKHGVARMEDTERPTRLGSGAWGRRQGLAGLRNDAPSEARGADGKQAARGADGKQAAHGADGKQAGLAGGSQRRRRAGSSRRGRRVGGPSGRAAATRHQHAEHAHTTRPGPAAPNSAEDPGLVKQSDQTVHHEGGECFERGLDLALGQRCERCDSVVGPGAREFARLIEHVVGAQAFHDRGEGLVGG